MTMKSASPVGRFKLALLTIAIAAPNVQAFQIDSGNSDWNIRWDNTVRYNMGLRAEGQSGKTGSSDPSGVYSAIADRQFDRGDVFINRLDILSEMDMVYKGRHGVRVSASGWYDPTSYGDKLHTGGDPVEAAACSGVYRDCEYSDYTNRFTSGPSGEILDAFVFTGFEIGESTVGIKAGRHNVFWGNSIFPSAAASSIANNQAASDFLKGAISPGTEAKELFLPQTQITSSLQLTPELSFAAQYSLEWRHDRLPEFGTFFGPGAALWNGPNGPGMHDPLHESGRDGDWGLMAKWAPSFLDGGNLGIYYREYFEKRANFFMTSSGVPQFGLQGIAYNPVKNKLWGLSGEYNLGGLNFGMELTYRQNASLAASGSGQNLAFIPGDGGFVPDTVYGFDDPDAGPRGDTYGAVLNVIKLLPPTALWDAGTVAGEISYLRLDKVTYNPDAVITAPAFGGLEVARIPKSGFTGGRDSTIAAVNFAPQWLQVAPGIDLSLPIFATWNVGGNSPVAQDPAGTVSYSVGLEALVYQVHTVKLAYNDTEHGDNDYLRDNHGWLSLSYKASF